MYSIYFLLKRCSKIVAVLLIALFVTKLVIKRAGTFVAKEAFFRMSTNEQNKTTPRVPENNKAVVAESTAWNPKDISMDPKATVRSRSWVSITTVITSVAGVGIGLAALTYSYSQIESLRVQTDISRTQLDASQRTTDWPVVGVVDVSLGEEMFYIDNPSTTALMTTATWLVGDMSGAREFDAMFFELGGIPACSRVEVPLESVVQRAVEVRNYETYPPRDDWPEFTSAYTYIVAPSGGLYSTSSEGGIIDHNVSHIVTQPNSNYGERFEDLPMSWDDPSHLIWVPDSFFEFSEMQIGQTPRPLHAGAPLLGRDDNISIVDIGCVN